MRTAEEIQDSLDSDFSWRRVEMHTLLTEMRAARGPAQDALCRAGLGLMYAHWEGFAKHALSQYLRFLSRRRLKLNELNLKLVALAVDGEMRRKTGASATQRRNELVRVLLESGDARLPLPRGEVDTQSNLNSEVCFDLLESVGLDSSAFATKAAFMDYRLLRARNEIAHGRFSAITARDYEEIHHEVLIMMELVRQLVMTSVDNGQYRRVQATTTV